MCAVYPKWSSLKLENMCVKMVLKCFCGCLFNTKFGVIFRFRLEMCICSYSFILFIDVKWLLFRGFEPPIALMNVRSEFIDEVSEEKYPKKVYESNQWSQSHINTESFDGFFFYLRLNLAKKWEINSRRIN